MAAVREQHLVGLDALRAITTLLQRVRNAHPTAGLYQAAEIQWWWRDARPTDLQPQLFWSDDESRFVAAVLATEFGNGSSAVFEDTTLTVVVLPDATPEWVEHVVTRGLEHAAASGLETVDIEVDQADTSLQAALTGAGFHRKADGIVSGWLLADRRPPVSPLADGYHLRSRAETTGRPHHFARRSGPSAEERLLQTSLYRPDLDLVVDDPDGEVAAYGLFWFDPVTETGVVEPMRTEDRHQRLGLARHVLTAGIDRLANAGAQRISIAWEPDNPASGHLYRSVGFEPIVHTELFNGPTRPATPAPPASPPPPDRSPDRSPDEPPEDRTTS